jgi:hypothetical protein
MPKRFRRSGRDLAGVPGWVTLLGVTATVRPAPEGSSEPSLMVLTTMAGTVVYPLEDQAGAPAPAILAGSPRRHRSTRAHQLSSAIR